MRSYDMDPGLFYIQFIVDPDSSTLKRLRKLEETVGAIIENKKYYKQTTMIAKVS